ncbi:MAG: MDR/zinc-dependent alcohol dehydrogenase-like family protein [Planctomycetota bacterium]
MQAVTFTDRLEVRTDYPEPVAAAGEVVVDVLTAGICSTDLEILRGYMGFTGVLGHEFVGRVADGPPAWAGKRVVAEINCVCGRCDMCTGGLAGHCRRRTVLGIDGRDGAFAEKVAVPVRNLHEVPQVVSDDEAVFAEPLAAALQLTRQIRFDIAQTVVVLGDGRLGQLVARVLRHTCPTLTLVGRHPAKLELAERQHIQTSLADDFVPRQAADVVIDATGTADGLALAMRTVRPRGTIALKSTVAGGASIDLSSLVINEVTVVGSRCGPLPDALTALASGDVDVTNLISRRFPLAAAAEAMGVAGRGDVVKVLLDVR